MKNVKDGQSSIFYTIFKTGIGWVGVIHSRKGLRRIFIGCLKRSQLINNIEEAFGKTLIKGPAAGELIENIIRFCSGKDTPFGRCKMDWSSLTPFQCKVLKEAMKIPYGTVTTYRNLAHSIGFPGSSRAVGNALSKNPFPLLIPCHRVVKGNGTIGGFSAEGGRLLKEKLLKMEHVNL